MALPDDKKGQRISLRFGAGINTAQSETDIDERECAAGSQNFGLAINDSFFSGRKPFDLVATAPNAAEVRGFAQLKKQNGTVSTLVQAGSNVYSWDGSTGFTLVGTVAAGAKLRGAPHRQNWTLDEYVIITDLELRQPVMTRDGTTFAELAHDLTGDFYAKYCFVEGEAAWFANIISGSTPTATPHMLVRSEVSNPLNLSVSDRPSSSLGVSDPFFLLTPDLRPINGILAAFGVIIVSSQDGRIYKITGTTAKDMDIAQLYDGSGADGSEPIELVGNDVFYGRAGAIESVFSVDTFGDVASDDISRPIADIVEEYDDWTLAFNPRLKKVYCFAAGRQECLVYHKTFLDDKRDRIASRREAPDNSAWSRWTTRHSMQFEPSVAMFMHRPTDVIEQVYLGGAAGQIFMLEGTGGQDGGSEDIESVRVSRVFQAPGDNVGFQISGFLSYRKQFAVPLTITLMYAGIRQADQEISLTMEENTNAQGFGGDAYFGGDFYFGVLFEGRLTRDQFSVAGLSSEFQIKIVADGNQEFSIERCQIEFPTGR